MGEIIVHFNKKQVANGIRMDYRWEHEGCEYLVTDIPCKHLPFASDNYLETHIMLGLNVIMELQKDQSLSNCVNFHEHEHLLESLKDHLKSKEDTPTSES